MARDPVASIREQWRRCRPDLDTSPMEIAGRLLLASSLLQNRVETLFRRHGLSSGGFDVLATLRRQGPPFELTPTVLYRELLISSGTMTHRLDGLESIGLIERHMNPSDRRGLIVRLTEKGLSLTDRLISEHLLHEKQLFGSIRSTDARVLSQILSRWIEGLKDE